VPIARSIYAFSRRPPFTPAPLNIAAAPFGAVGNGSTDNTAAIRGAALIGYTRRSAGHV
jgi:polygalacturonase